MLEYQVGEEDEAIEAAKNESGSSMALEFRARVASETGAQGSLAQFTTT